MVSPNEFRQIVSGFGEKKFVKAPWTIKESVLADRAYTSDVFDCTVCGLTDGKQVLMTHICPTNPDNNNFSTIVDFIKRKIPFSENLQGFILGSKPDNFDSPDSTKLFDKFVNFMNKNKIPFSQFKGGPYENNVAYSSISDEWVIGNYLITPQLKKILTNPKEIFNQIFAKVEVSDLDEIVW